MQHLPAITHPWFSLFRFRSPLLTESRLFSLPVGTEMFHFPTFPPHALYIQARVTRHHSCWVSPFGHPRITARLTAPRGLSQPPTSFIGSWCQGIHRTLFITYNKDARVHCAVLKQHTILRPSVTRRVLDPSPSFPPLKNTPITNPSKKPRYDRTFQSSLSLLPREETLACSLRTQQYADIICSPTSTEAGSNENECLSASTHEQPPFHIRERNGLCFPQPHLCAASERDAP